MNDSNRAAVPAFKDIEPLEETVITQCFGKISIRDIGANRVETLMIKHQKDETNLPLLRTLLCEAAEGEHGERFTMALLDKLPARAIQDRTALMLAVGRVNGVSRGDVEKE